MLLLLEDDADRVRRFQAVLDRIAPGLEVRLWRNAWSMIADLDVALPQATLISLDHDLEPEPGSLQDPGTGWDVVQILAVRRPRLPVIVHTSNGDRGTWMMGEFELEGWKAQRVYPIGEDWIEVSWRQVVRRLLRRPR